MDKFDEQLGKLTDHLACVSIQIAELFSEMMIDEFIKWASGNGYIPEGSGPSGQIEDAVAPFLEWAKENEFAG